MYGADFDYWGPFHEVGEYLIEEKGISVVPVMPSDKKPASWNPYAAAVTPMLDWTKYSKRLPTKEEYKLWSDTPDQNIGVPLGEFNKLVALDLDDHEELHDDIIAMLDELSAVGKKAKRGKTYFFKYSGETTRIWHHPKTGDTIVELLSEGRQTVIPPSWHPDGVSYTWLNEEFTLLNTDIDDLPELPRDFVKQMDEYVTLLAPKGVKPTVRKTTEGELKDIQAALNHIPSDNYDSWIRIGMALNDWSNSRGLDLWDSWSKSSDKYKDGECAKKWNSFTPGRGLGIGSIFYQARQFGFVVTKKIEEKFEIPPEFLRSLEKEDKPKFYLDPSIVSSTPGLVGRIKDWIIQTASMPQPELSLAAAITLIGALKGGKVQTETGLRTNIYMLGVAPASSGKGHPQRAVQKLLLESKQMKYLGSKPTSDSGVYFMLEQYRNRIIVWDEVGKALSAISGNGKSNSHLASVITALMEIFSCADRTFLGKEMAKKERGDNKRIEIQEPCLGLLGYTTKEVLFDSLSSEMLADGFLSRILILEPTIPYPKRRFSSGMDVPSDILDGLEYIRDELGEELSPENLEGGAQIVPYSAPAKELLERLSMEYDSKRDALYEQGGGLESFWGRALEHTQKIALTVSSGEFIQYEDVFWAAQLVRTCTENTLGTTEGIGLSELSSKKERVLKLVKKHGTIPSGLLRSRAAEITGSKRGGEDVISLLYGTGDISTDDDGKFGRGSKCFITPPAK